MDDTQRLEQIRRAHASAKPDPRLNTAWANLHHDMAFVLANLDALTKDYAIAAGERDVAESKLDRCVELLRASQTVCVHQFTGRASRIEGEIKSFLSAFPEPPK